jgi:hypothetical protein
MPHLTKKQHNEQKHKPDDSEINCAKFDGLYQPLAGF